MRWRYEAGVESSPEITIRELPYESSDLYYHTHTRSQWLTLPRTTYPRWPPESFHSDFTVLTSVPIDGLHYFSNHIDLTRPFPSPHSPFSYNEEFCWNHTLRSEFERYTEISVPL